MFFRVEFSTYDVELIAVLTKIKGKKPYLVEKALTHFITIPAGKDVVDALVSAKETKKTKKLETKMAKEKTPKTKKEKTSLKEKEFFIDKFL